MITQIINGRSYSITDLKYTVMNGVQSAYIMFKVGIIDEFGITVREFDWEMDFNDEQAGMLMQVLQGAFGGAIVERIKVEDIYNR